MGRRSLRCGLIILMVMAAPTALGGDVGLTLTGFGTLGLARSSDDSAEFVRDLSQSHGLQEEWRFETDSLLGIQANLTLGQDVAAVIQAVSRDNPYESFAPDVTWAFLRYDPSPDWTIRAGRLGTEFYMLADSRMVGYTYLTVRPPVDYYGSLPFDFIDGLDVALVHPLAGGLLETKVFAGVSRQTSPWDDLQYSLSGTLLVGGYLDFRDGPWQIRLGHIGVRFEHDLPVEDFYRALPEETANELRLAGHWTGFTSLGLVYDASPFQAQFMLSRTTNEQATLEDTWAGYLIASYRLGDVTPFLGLSAAKSERKRPSHPIPGYTDAYQANFGNDQKTFFVGGRWDFMPNLCLKAQVDLVRGTSDSRFLYRWETPGNWDGTMTVFSLALDFVF